MHPSLQGAPFAQGELAISLDGLPVAIPVNRRSLTGIRAYLETLAMEQQRVLASVCVDGQAVDFAAGSDGPTVFSRVEADSISLDEIPLQLLKTARAQITAARERCQQAVTLVLINDGVCAREFWWQLAQELRAPLLTLALMPDPAQNYASGAASPAQLRRWQLQQLAAIIRSVDEVSEADDMISLSTALENRALPWLEKLHAFVGLWEETVSAGHRLAHAA